jgi:hypothetical protein
MIQEAKRIKDIEYNELITLQIVEEDSDLNKIFSDEIKISFKLLKTISKQSQLNPQTKELLKGIFEKVILTKKDLIDKYLRLAKADGKELKVTNVIEPIESEGVTEGLNEGVEEEKEEEEEEPQVYIQPKTESKTVKAKPVKAKTEKVRRYGKDKIKKDIEAQGGKATQLHNAMLKINDLKNLWVNISARGVKDMTTGTTILSDEDCRTIISVVTIAERKLEDILKKKK